MSRQPTARCSGRGRRFATTLLSHRANWSAREPSPAERDLPARFIDAHEWCDAAGALAVAAEDVRVTMPPAPMCFDGRAALVPLLA